jgi:hypothetical protein
LNLSATMSALKVYNAKELSKISRSTLLDCSILLIKTYLRVVIW